VQTGNEDAGSLFLPLVSTPSLGNVLFLFSRKKCTLLPARYSQGGEPTWAPSLLFHSSCQALQAKTFFSPQPGDSTWMVALSSFVPLMGPKSAFFPAITPIRNHLFSRHGVRIPSPPGPRGWHPPPPPQRTSTSSSLKT